VSRARVRTPATVRPYGQHRPRIAPSAFIAPGVWLIGQVTVEQDASVWFGAVVRGDMGPIVIGPESIVEDNAVVHGRVTTGRGAIVAHGAVVQDCTLGDRAVVGANAVAFNATIGEGSIVTIGSVVYPGTVIPPFTVFRNGAGGNQPSLQPVGDRLKKWDAGNYRSLIEVYGQTPVGRRTAAARNAGRRARSSQKTAPPATTTRSRSRTGRASGGGRSPTGRASTASRARSTTTA
jgi:carbonic anhydrase/acetyltransferase-like protein (isoleucine patch superfamily)